MRLITLKTTLISSYYEKEILYYLPEDDNSLAKHVRVLISLICDKSVTTQNLALLSYWYRRKRLRMHF